MRIWWALLFQFSRGTPECCSLAAVTIILETERLFLRELLLNDVEPLTVLLSSPEVTRFTGGPRDENAVRRFVQAQHESYREHGYGYWAVVHRDSGALVGRAGITSASTPMLGCELDAAYWGHGLGKEVSAALRDHAFNELSLERVAASVDRKDEAGLRIAEAIGMELLSDDDPHVIIYAIRKEPK